MKIKRLIPAFAMLLVSAILLGTSTFAWFSMNREVSAVNMQITAKSNSTFLLIGNALLRNAQTNELAESTAAQVQGQSGDDLTSEDLTVLSADAAVYPSKPYGDDELDPTIAGAYEVEDKATAAEVGNWYTANSKDPTVWGSDDNANNDKVINVNRLNNTANSTFNFSNYVIKRSVNLTLAVGSTKANNLRVIPTIEVLKNYVPTSDTAINNSKTYYTLSGTNEYTEVTEPDVSAINTYYELKPDDFSAVKVLIVSDNGVVQIMDQDDSGNAIDLFDTTHNNNITDSAVHNVDIYIYYDGTEGAVYTNNKENLAGAKIDLQFTVEVNEN